MIIGGHTIIYSTDAEADRAFVRDVLGFPHVDVGGGWLIFALKGGELAFHPHDKNDMHEIYLMTDDLDAEMKRIGAAGVTFDDIQEQPYGRVTAIHLPGGGKLGLYQPTHELALGKA